uniref:Ribosomal_L14e domain-containing protein n=1 Tax=Caenorhabditis tropicalis TaxID=1561998 RepID=A0A1I7UDP9_9PELO
MGGGTTESRPIKTVHYRASSLLIPPDEAADVIARRRRNEQYLRDYRRAVLEQLERKKKAFNQILAHRSFHYHAKFKPQKKPFFKSLSLVKHEKYRLRQVKCFRRWRAWTDYESAQTARFVRQWSKVQIMDRIKKLKAEKKRRAARKSKKEKSKEASTSKAGK